MMKYEIFKEVVADTFRDYLPEQYRSMDLRVESVNKVNRMLDGITLVSAGADKNISPFKYGYRKGAVKRKRRKQNATKD